MDLPTCQVLDLGRVDYQTAWDLQNELAKEIAAGNHPPALLLLEHPHTYTFGRSGHIENMLWDRAELERRGVQVFWVDRGGDVTYHGPGQLVGYPLLPLGAIREARSGINAEPAPAPSVDYVGYVRRLEEALILALQDLGVKAHRQRGMTGVWVNSETGSEGVNASAGPLQPAKIAAIGVKVDARGITRHGFGLNVNPDMLYWQGIIACGLAHTSITSLAEICRPVPGMDEVRKVVITAFGRVFRCEMKVS